MAVSFDVNSDEIWRVMYAFIGNEYGVAGMMGNIWAESGFQPNNMENVGTQFGWTDTSYTDAVNNGTENFMRLYPIPNSQGGTTNRPLGYGICQWTSVGRKQGLWDLKVQQGVGIENIDLQLDWLKAELQSSSYSSVLTVLQNATSVREASDYFLAHFEIPAGYDTPEVQERRWGYGMEVYEHYSTEPPPPPPPPVPPKFRKMPIYMMLRYYILN